MIPLQPATFPPARLGQIREAQNAQASVGGWRRRRAPIDTVSNVVHETAVRRPSEWEHRSLVNNLAASQIRPGSRALAPPFPPSLRLRFTCPPAEPPTET